MVGLGLNGKIPAGELREVAKQYEQDGMAPEQALQRAVEDKLQLLQMEERRIVAAVRTAWEAQGGTKRARKLAQVQNEPAPAAPAGEGTKAPKVKEDPLRALNHGRDDWIPKGDLKTYTATEAKTVWDTSSPGFKRVMMGRIERAGDDPMVGKKWDELTPIERKLAHGALNEDHYSGSWYTNKKGARVDRFRMEAASSEAALAEQKRTADAQAMQEAGERWAAVPYENRKRMLYDLGYNDQDATGAAASPFASFKAELRDQLAPQLAQAAAPVPAAQVEQPAKKAKKGSSAPGEATLRQDWGVDVIDGYASTDEHTADTNRDSPAGGVKDAFLKDSQRYLKDVVGLLLDAGWTNAAQRDGKAMKPVSVNESGDATSGTVSMTMLNDKAGRGIYVQIGDLNIAPKTRAGISLMMRVTDKGDPYVGRENMFMEPTLTSRELADKIIAAVDRVTSTGKPAKLATNVWTDQRNGSSNTGSAGAQALGDLAPATDGRAESGEGVHGSDGSSGLASAQGTATPDAPGREGARGAGSGVAEVHPADTGTAGRGRLGGKRAGREGAPVSGHDAGPRVADIAPAVPPAPQIPAVNFRITEDVRLGQGGEVEKFNDNLAAIRTLQAIERENRRATPEEQAMIARYVGWGGLANAFPNPETGEFKDAWKKRGAELAELLTPKEYALARRSTLDSHYTSQTVVDSMWGAVKHLGVKGGLFLESSMGIGNFLGRMPFDIAGNSKFIGVEYDSLTARMAALLYPAETVLNSGFQSVPLSDGAFDLAIGNPPFGEQSLRFQFKPELNGHSIHNQFFIASLDALRPGGVLVQVVSRYLMDKQDKSSRIALAKRAKLLGAIRLPDTAFKENARTEVVTDIVFLQRLSPAEQTEMEDAFAAAATKPGRDREKENERQRLAALVPKWVETLSVNDPLGGEKMPVNHYFATNPGMIMGTLERSGSMKHGADITVRLDKGADLGKMLADAIAKLPQGVAEQDQTAIDRAKARHEDMSNALRIALAGHENGSIKLEAGGVLEQVIERETPEGAYELTKRALTPAAPWSDALYMNGDGKWYTVEAKLDNDGKPVKQVKDGKPTKLNVYERKVFDTDADIPASMLLGQSRYDRLKELVKMRDLLKEQLAMEAENHNASLIEANRAEMRSAYDAFVKKHGLISEPANSGLVNGMPDGALVQALEFGYRPAITAAQAARSGEKVRAASATPAPILSERVIFQYKPAESADSLADAISINRAESGTVDIDRIASLLGKTVEQVEQEIEAAEHPLLFKDPETQRWESRNDYLTGHVKRKLQAAQAARMSKNVEALQAVQPEPWGAENVTALLGSSWIPPFVYGDFVEHIAGVPARVGYSALTNSYNINVGSSVKADRESEWATPGYSSVALISDILNNHQIKVTYRDMDGKTHVDGEKTALALLKAKAINAEWADWVYKDGERRGKLVEIFNEKFNTRVMRQHDGSHLILPGKVPDEIIGMRRHQKNAIWRGVSERFMLADHAVGAGKTFTAIARAMERRRMGLSKKPAIIVPNHMVDQFTADVYRLYPAAKVLAAGKKDFEKSRRRKLFAKIATGDWDIVIIPHSSFGFIDIAPETEERYLQMELDSALEAVKDAEEEAEANGDGGGFRKPFGVKEAERLVEKITQRMDKVRGNKNRDRLLTFEQLGIDDMTVDEAHEFKNLFYSSRLTGVKGMGNKTGSQKAFDLYNKVRVLAESPTGSVLFMTGTPISNSAVEMYTMMRYLAAGELADLGLEHFDAWRAQYVSTDPGWEPTETGRLKEVNRLGRTWSNMRSLMELYYSFTDAVDNDDIKKAYAEDNDGAAFPIPRVTGGDRQSVVIAPTKAQVALLEDVLQGFDNLPSIKDPFDRNKTRLRLMDRARKVSLDVRAAESSSKSDEKGGKLDVLADNVKRIYSKWHADRGTQLIFLDRSVPKSKGDDAMLKEYDALVAAQRKALEDGDEAAQRRADESLERFDPNEMEELRNAQAGGWNAYQQIKDNLIARGIPANEIRFIQEANTDAQKQALFDAVNAGHVRVLIGSTPRMGAGTNVQKLLVGLHHADVTWKPSDIEQREGRIIRQGNELLKKYGVDKFEVEILAYATERTIDAKMWSLNASKLKTINAIRNYDGAFSMDFEDEDSVSMAELAALASGDPLLLERVKLMSEIDKLELLKRAHARKEWAVVGQIEDAEKDIANLPRRITVAEQDAAAALAGAQAMEESAQGRTVSIEGVIYTSGTEARKAVYQIFKEQSGGDEKAKVSISVGKRRLTSLDGALAAVGTEMGDEQTFAMTVDFKDYIARTDAARAIAELAKDRSVGLNEDDATTVDLGEFYGMTLSATFSRAPHAGFWTSLAVLRPDGSTLASGETRLREDWQYTTSGMRTALDELEKLVQPKRLEYVRETLERKLARAHASLPELQARRGGPFKQQAELDEKNARLEEVIRQLSSGPSTPARSITLRGNPLRNVDGSYRRQEPMPMMRGQSKVLEPSKMLPRAVVEEEIFKRIGKFEHQPPILVADSITDVFPDLAPGSAYGLTHKGRIYLFRDALPNLREVQRTLFHEMLHYGLRRFLTSEQYNSQMMNLYQADKSAKAYADWWVTTTQGRKVTAARGAETARVFGVDEYLAWWAEGGRGEYKDNSLRARSARQILRWLANLANFLGFPPGVAAWLNGRTAPQAHDLIKSIFAKMETNAPRANPWLDEEAASFRRPEWASDATAEELGGLHRPIEDIREEEPGQDQGNFAKWFGNSKVVDPQSGEPLRVYHGTVADFDAFDATKRGATTMHPTARAGFFFSASPEVAAQFAGESLAGKPLRPTYKDGANVMPVYLAISNPLRIPAAEFMRKYVAERADLDRLAQRAQAAGHDGILIEGDAKLGAMWGGAEHGADTWVAFKPEQVKSATGNSGAYGTDTSNIMFRETGLGEALAGAMNNAAAVRLPAGYQLGDLFNKSGKISWWHKTIGTMDNLAKHHPAFAPVYSAVQSFLGDVSRFATVPADAAPRLLPKLEDIKDIIGKDRKKPVTAADTKAIAAPIFEGTLIWARDSHGEPVKVKDLEEQAAAMTVGQKAQVLLHKGVITDEQNRAWLASPLDFYDATIERRYAESELKAGVVWSDKELRGLFRLDDEQIALYREFRAATDKSLANLTITEMIKMGGKDAEGMLEPALDAAADPRHLYAGVDAAAELLRDHFIKLAQDVPDMQDMHLATAKKIMDLGDRATDLMDRGYAPLSRFGKYTVYVTEENEDGESEQVYFGMFETSAEAARMARHMTGAHPEAQVMQGTVSEQAYKLFAGVAPETIELFGSMVGMDNVNPEARSVYETYLQLAKSNRSAMKRMIQRKGIAGFSEDAGRVLASFIYSNARLAAGNAHLGEIDAAVSEIPQGLGELKDAAMELRSHIKDPQGGGTMLGGMMFAQFLGGSIASAMVNLTQPFTMTLPYLSQWGGLAGAGKRLGEAIRLARKDVTGDARLDAALKWATEEGIVAPQEIHYLQAQASGKAQLRTGDGTKAGDARAMLNNTMAKVSLGWGKLFAMAELANRRITFIAAYQTAVAQRIANPAGFAEEAVRQTQGTYNSGNKPRWARGTLGGLAMTFKQYSIAYLELLTRMFTAGAPGSPERAAGRRAALYMVAILFLMAGADGLPFEQDLEDALDGILQRFGYNFSTKREKQAFLTEVLGQGGADFVLKGMSAVPGMPIDVAGRFGMGNLIPATGLLTKKDSYTSDLGELAGPAGDIAKRAFTATGKLLGGDIGGAALDISPASVRNVIKGVDMLDSGAYKDTRGYKVNDVTPTEAVLKAIGFQPSSTADIQDNKGQALNMIAQTRMRSVEIAERWSQGIASGDEKMIQEARAMRDDWNRKNPETPIRVNMPAVIKRARAMRQDVLNRTKMTAPKALKASVRAELAQVRD